MSASTKIVLTIFAAFLIFVTARGNLPDYLRLTI
jgi:hypothetical protein